MFLIRFKKNIKKYKYKFIFILCCILKISLVQSEGLENIIERGYIEFAVYENFPPFSYRDKESNIKGIDIDLGNEIANYMGIKAIFRLFLADESVDDDLRNMVWKGHYIAGKPADIMLHVPYDPNFAQKNNHIIFTQPYYAELIAFALNNSLTKNAITLEIFSKEFIGVETSSLADSYLLGSFGGKFRNNIKHYPSIPNAAKAMIKGDISAIMATRSEIDYSLNIYDHSFKITKLPTPGLAINGWELCAAVKTTNVELANIINKIIGKLKQSDKIKRIFNKHKITYNSTDKIDILSFKNVSDRE
jgi:polar amino acid transport system substrate-binding protein